MASNGRGPAHSDYQDWLNADPEPGWYEPGEGHRIETAFMAGWRRGVTYLATRIAGEIGVAGMPQAATDDLLKRADMEAPRDP